MDDERAPMVGEFNGRWQMKGKVVKTEEEWRRILTPEQFQICRNRGTERAFSGAYYDCKEDGTYHCVCCGTPLFESKTKYDSGTGWPSFWAPADEDNIRLAEDHSYGMHRTEVLCDGCDAHLGHVFGDGPEPTHKRYCINSSALKLRKANEAT